MEKGGNLIIKRRLTGDGDGVVDRRTKQRRARVGARGHIVGVGVLWCLLDGGDCDGGGNAVELALWRNLGLNRWC